SIGPTPKSANVRTAVAPPPLRAYKTHASGNAVVVCDLVSNTVVKTIPVGTRPSGLDITPDQKTAVVANRGSGSVSIIDLGTLAGLSTVSRGAGVTRPCGAIARAGSFAF